jgi:uncharacterized membrane protein YgcG
MEDQDSTSVCRVSLLISALASVTAVMAGMAVIAGVDHMRRNEYREQARRIMKLSIAVAFLPLLLFPSPLRAEVWRCPQENGPDIFTNLPSDASKCEKYVSSTERIPAPSPASPPPASNSQASPAILVPYAHDGPTPPEYNVPYYPDYPDYYYSYPFYPYYGFGFFGFRRPHSRFALGFSHPRGRSFNGGRSLGGGRSFGGGHSSGHR